MYFGCCIYVLLLLNMPEMAHDWINKSILFYSILFYSMIIMNFSKAFDKVPHRRLLHKLDYYGIRGSTRRRWCRRVSGIVFSFGGQFPDY